MSLFAFALILTAAFVHAGWNFLAKRSGGSAGFVWAYSALSVVLYLPLAIYSIVSQNFTFDLPRILIIATSGFIHALYFLALQKGYRVGDFSLVYPLARGTGPMLSTTAAILFFNERPSLLAMAGAALIVVGVFVLSWSATGGATQTDASKSSATTQNNRKQILFELRDFFSRPTRADATKLLSRRTTRSWAIGFGLLTGALIATYTLWDKNAVSNFAIPVIVYENFGDWARAIILSPIALSRWQEVKREWREHRALVLGVAALSPLSYLLVLTAMVTTPVSYVAPARELSILIGAVMGTHLLSEGDTRRRLTAAGAIVAGVIALALG